MFYPFGNMTHGTEMALDEKISVIKDKIKTSDAVLIGAGSGLSTAAGYIYTGQRFQKYFADFIAKYGIGDMYSGGFYPYSTPEEFWGFWCRYIWINRYAPIPTDLYSKLFGLVEGRDYFVLTTNVDHCFQRSGFDKRRLFYTQGDYGLFQSTSPSGKSKKRTYDNYETIRQMILSEGFEISGKNELVIPENVRLKMTVPSDLVPYCPDDGQAMTTNLRSDDKFVEDDGWNRAQIGYHEFLRDHDGLNVLFLELGVGLNTPGIIKIPFWQYCAENANSFYACVNLNGAWCPEGIKDRAVCIDADISGVINSLAED